MSDEQHTRDSAQEENVAAAADTDDAANLTDLQLDMAQKAPEGECTEHEPHADQDGGLFCDADANHAAEGSLAPADEPTMGEPSPQPEPPRILTRDEYEAFGDDPLPLPEGFEIIEGGASEHRGAVQAPADQPAPANGTHAEKPADAATTRVAAPATDAEEPTRSPLTHAASEAAASFGSLISHGANAVRAVAEAKRAHADAREQLEELDRHIAEQTEELNHRRDIERRYREILADEAARSADAQDAIAEATVQKQALADAIATLKQQLDRMKETDVATERRLKAALDAAEGKEASAREDAARVKRRLTDAQRALERAEQNRTAGIKAARQAVESAQARLNTLREEFADVQRNPSANSAAYSVRAGELDAEISDAAHELRCATDELPRITAELDRAYETAKRLVAEAQKPIDGAKKKFRAVADETQSAREAYDAAREEAAARQKELKGRITAQERAVKEQDAAIERAQELIEQSGAVVTEANEIHATPEITERIAAALEADRAERVELVHQVEHLASREETVRDRTRSYRVKFIGLIVAGIALIAIIIAVIVALSSI